MKKAPYVDRQCAVVFELRRFKHYRELTTTILEWLRKDWKDEHPRLKNEINLTLDDIKRPRFFGLRLRGASAHTITSG